MDKLLCPEPLEQSVLGALPAIRTDETDRPKRPALASQLYHEQSCFQSSARPTSDPDIANHTDVRGGGGGLAKFDLSGVGHGSAGRSRN